jgi:mannosyltransferase OCH1-like enzyme
MYSVGSKCRCNISNLILTTNFDETNTIYDFEITYVDENRFNLKVNLIDGNECKIKIINKNNENENFYLEIKDNFFYETIYTSFQLIIDDNTSIYNIPKIIHQSYKIGVKKNIFNAVNTWKSMNINYEYKYWDDNACYNFLVDHFDEKVLDAYNSLYAGAFKSDIFRLCVLYIFGGIWSDISSSCIISIDKIITNNKLNLLVVKDNPSQKYYGNIYQAFIIVEQNSFIIKSILDFTVDKVLNYNHYNTIYPELLGDSIAVTGPTVFAIGLNKFLERPDLQIINDNTVYVFRNNKNYFIKFIDHYHGEILFDNKKIIKSKYNNWENDRSNVHYSELFKQGYIYKNKVGDIQLNENLPTIYQIWIQNEFVSRKMYEAIQTIVNNHPNFNYKLLTNDKILKLIKNDEEFPLLLKAYNKVIPYAFKSDLIRYYILYKNGGIYIDSDFVNVNNVIELYFKYDIVFCKDLNMNQISNGFICSSKKENAFFKTVIDKVIDNILNKTSFQSDLYITGPGVFGECVSQYFNIKKPIYQGYYIEKNCKIKILNHSFDLPIPSGNWIESSRDFSVKDNILKTECRNNSGDWIKNSIKFSVGDFIINDNGILINNSNIDYHPCDGSTILYDEEKIYFFTKFPNFNQEKIILDGNSYSEMYLNKNFFNE